MVFRNEYAFLSNMFPSTITLNGLTFSCAESAFQAYKCTAHDDVLRLQAMNGVNAKSFGRTVKMRSDWNTFRLTAMYHVLKAKFIQHPELLAKLKAISTPIVEDNTWHDTYWGVCNNVGQNHLGIILDELKEIL